MCMEMTEEVMSNRTHMRLKVDMVKIIHYLVKKATERHCGGQIHPKAFIGAPQTMDLSVVAIKDRIEEMKAESDEASQKESMTLLPFFG